MEYLQFGFTILFALIVVTILIRAWMKFVGYIIDKLGELLKKIRKL